MKPNVGSSTSVSGGGSASAISSTSSSHRMLLLVGFIGVFLLGIVMGTLLSGSVHLCSSEQQQQHLQQQQQQQQQGRTVSDDGGGGAGRDALASGGGGAKPESDDDPQGNNGLISIPRRAANDGVANANNNNLPVVTNDPDSPTIPPLTGLEFRKRARCPAHRRIQGTLSRFIDIDFIEWVTSSCPDPSRALVLDIGLFHGGEVAKMARQGFNVIGFEPNPVRYGFCKKEINELSPAQRARVQLHNAAVSDQAQPLYFQLAGVDSHAYLVSPGGPTKIKTIVVPSTPISTVFEKHRDFYFVKIDTQGFDTRILESMLGAMQDHNATAEFIQFEFSPHFEVTRSKRSKDDHKRFFRLLQDAGYDIFMGAVVQPWLKSMRSTYGKTPLSMISPEFRGVPTCIDDFVEYMHRGKETPIRPGKTSTEFGSWADLLAVRRSDTTPYYRNTGWVIARRM